MGSVILGIDALFIQNKLNRSIFNALPPTQQVDTLQNCRDTGMRVSDISKMTGIPESTIYSKTKTKTKK